VGAPGSGTEETARLIIESYGLRYSDLRADFSSFGEIAEQMQKGRLDAGFIVANYPVPAIIEIGEASGMRLIPMDREMINRSGGRYLFFRPLVIPAGTYRDQAADVTTLAVDNVLICREDLDENLVYALTKTLFDALPDLVQTHVAAKAVSVEGGPATPLPLHPGAARFYRERELLQ